MGDQTARKRRVVEADLKNPADVEKVVRAAGARRHLIEGFRPGVMERMGLGPESSWNAARVGLRPHDGLGPGRSARAVRGP
ncbi:hypothetical protein GS421_13565 [Rhodococcus hoagii]|nr:hypothetical protein [Prescottella equi]